MWLAPRLCRSTRHKHISRQDPFHLSPPHLSIKKPIADSKIALFCYPLSAIFLRANPSNTLWLQGRRASPKSLEPQVGCQQTNPDELTQVSDSGECEQLTTLWLQGRRGLVIDGIPDDWARHTMATTTSTPQLTANNFNDFHPFFTQLGVGFGITVIG